MAIDDRNSPTGGVTANIASKDEALSSSEVDNIMNSAEIKNEFEEPGDETLEKYGVWVKVKPEKIEGVLEEEAAFELSDLEAPAEEKLTADEEALLGQLESKAAPEGKEQGVLPGGELPDLSELAEDIDLAIPTAETIEEGPPAGAGEAAAREKPLPDLELEAFTEPSGREITLPTAEEGLEELEIEEAVGPESRENLPELELEELPPEQAVAEEPQIEVPLSLETPLAAHFDDLSALESDLSAKEADLVVEKPSRETSASVLAKIEQELQAIRGEIQSLKRELSRLGQPKVGKEEVEVAPAPPQEAGFFEEEEDDTIALTGDELDNILNTAEITEETSAAPAVGAEEGIFDLEAGEQIIKPGSVSPAAQKEVKAPAAETGKTAVLEEAVEGEELEEIEISIPEQGEAGETAEALEIVLEEEAPAQADLELELPAEEDLSVSSLDLETLEIPTEELPADKGAAQGETELSLLQEPEAAEAELEMEMPAIGGQGPLEEELVLEEPTSEELAMEEAEPIESETGAETPDSLGKLEEDLTDLEALEPVTEPAAQGTAQAVPEELKADIKSVLSYLDQLLESLPEDKIREFANSEHFGVYKKLFEELGLEA